MPMKLWELNDALQIGLRTRPPPVLQWLNFGRLMKCQMMAGG